MKITKQELVELIKEELDVLLSEGDPFAELDAETAKMPARSVGPSIQTQMMAAAAGQKSKPAPTATPKTSVAKTPKSKPAPTATPKTPVAKTPPAVKTSTTQARQPRPGSLAARAAQRRKDRASQGIGMSRTEKGVDTKLVGKE